MSRILKILKKLWTFRCFSVSSGDSHRVTSLAIARSLDSDMKNMSGSSKRPPELGDTACQSWVISWKSVIFCPISHGFGPKNVSKTNENQWKSMKINENVTICYRSLLFFCDVYMNILHSNQDITQPFERCTAPSPSPIPQSRPGAPSRNPHTPCVLPGRIVADPSGASRWAIQNWSAEN